MDKNRFLKSLNNMGKLLEFASPNENNVEAVLDWIMPDLDPDDLGRSLKFYYMYLETNDNKYLDKCDPIPALFSKYTMIQKHMKVSLRLGKAWWVYIQKYMANPQTVVEMIGKKNPRIAKMVNTPLGNEYMKYFADRLYKFFDVYFHKFPRWHNQCGGLILYACINYRTQAWGFQCRKCKIPISTETMEETTHGKRTHDMPKRNKKD
jgi:hypothetical protein